jgi:hypothetical protein
VAAKVPSDDVVVRNARLAVETAKIVENRREEQKKAALLSGLLFYASSMGAHLPVHRKAAERMRREEVKIYIFKRERKQLRIC